MRLGLSIACLFAAMVFVPVSGADPTLSCGAVVSEDVTLAASLTDCATGLVVGADNITIDLNGYAIKGLGTTSGVGVQATDRTGVTVKNGKITDFAEGVSLFNSSNSTIEGLVIRRTHTGIRVTRSDNSVDANQILDNKVRESVDGVVVAGTSSRIVGNILSDLEGNGILCTFSSQVEIEGNRAVRGRVGIGLFMCGGSVTENVASDNVSGGIVRTRSNGATVRNVAKRNGGNGLLIDESHGLILGNVANSNAGNGLWILDAGPDHGPLYTVTANTANRNGELGIMTTLIGVVDGGFNHARHNANSLECMGVYCD
jgi:parallel beta-helix repeat protein